MSGPDQTAIDELVSRQAAFLRNPLQLQEGVCSVCRAQANVGFDCCYTCGSHIRAAAATGTADAIVPISYAIKRTQHAHNLWAYKAAPPSQTARLNLLALSWRFLSVHYTCLTQAAGGDFTAVSYVPSTRGRAGEHPVAGMLRQLIGLPQISATASTLYETDDREFHADRFRLNEFTASQLQRVLLLDDTWTTGGRIQSLSYALKVAGARSVVAVILGRHINPDWDPSRPIIEAIRQRPFDINRCVLDS